MGRIVLVVLIIDRLYSDWYSSLVVWILMLSLETLMVQASDGNCGPCAKVCSFFHLNVWAVSYRCNDKSWVSLIIYLWDSMILTYRDVSIPAKSDCFREIKSLLLSCILLQLPFPVLRFLNFFEKASVFSGTFYLVLICNSWICNSGFDNLRAKAPSCFIYLTLLTLSV